MTNSTSMPVVPDLAELSVALESAMQRTIAIARSGGDPKAPVPSLNWNASETGTHLMWALFAFAGAISGEPLNAGFPEVSWDNNMRDYLAVINDQALSASGERSMEDVAEGLEQAYEALKKVIASSPNLEAAVPTSWYGPDQTRTVGTLLALSVTETLVHGWDMARAFKIDGEFTVEEARAAFPTVMSQMLPILVNPNLPDGFKASYEIRIHEATPFVLRIADGKAVAEPAGEPVDCIITMNPRYGLLTGFRRVPLWKGIIGGHTMAAGDKPWLAFKFQKIFMSA
ncbi:MAG: hypothetical protein E6Q27_07700 [Aeromicrobium sp.]|nr:MAG: hypothetical protein E6Q27_07700 [Aeromicrobium sp.]